MNKKKNILIAVADDASHFGCYGHRFVHTPTIDSLAEEGIRFDNAFTCNPKCAPSRASILTGKYSWQLREAMNHFCVFPGGERFIPDYLEDAGYFVGYTGKGWVPGDFSAYSRNPAGNAFNTLKTEKQEGTCINTCDYAGNFKQFLRERGDKPFYFWFGCYEPHRPYIFGEGRGSAPLEAVDLPPYLPDDDVVRADFLDYAYEINWFDRQLGEMVDHLKSIGEYENTLILVLSDNGCPFPRVKGQMYEQDFHLPLIASCPDLMKSESHVCKDIINFVDILPTLLDYANAPKIENGVGHSFLPILTGEKYDPNIYAFFGREKHDSGRENDLGYPVRCVRNERYLLIYNFEPERYPAGNPETGFTNCDSSPSKDLIIELHKQGKNLYYELAFGKRPQIELYDIIEDEACMNNLANSDEYDSVVKELTSTLFSYLTDTKDPRVTGDKDYFDRMPLLTDERPYSWYAYTHGYWEKQDF